MSYVIRNCPAITTGWNDKNYICNTQQMGCGHCQDCTDCLLKRIVELCSFNYTKGNTNLLAKEILKLLDIEEINK